MVWSVCLVAGSRVEVVGAMVVFHWWPRLGSVLVLVRLDPLQVLVSLVLVLVLVLVRLGLSIK